MKQARQELSDALQRHGAPSILNEYQPLDGVSGIKYTSRDFTNTTQVRSAIGHKVSAVRKRFQRCELSDGDLLEPRLDASLAGSRQAANRTLTP